jgi:hypothetical protein
MTVRLADVAVAAWVVVWVVLAIAVFQEVRGLRDVSRTLVQTGQAIDRTGAALQTLQDVPFVGGDIRTYAREVRQAGRSAQRSGRSSKGNIENLSVLLAIAIGVVPSVPVVALYLPLRRVWRRRPAAPEVGVP